MVDYRSQLALLCTYVANMRSRPCLFLSFVQCQQCVCVFHINVKWPRSAIAAPIPRVLTPVGQTFVFHSRRGCFLLPKQALTDIGKRSQNYKTNLPCPALRLGADTEFVIHSARYRKKEEIVITISDMSLSTTPHTH